MVTISKQVMALGMFIISQLNVFENEERSKTDAFQKYFKSSTTLCTLEICSTPPLVAPGKKSAILADIIVRS